MPPLTMDSPPTSHNKPNFGWFKRKASEGARSKAPISPIGPVSPLEPPRIELQLPGEGFSHSVADEAANEAAPASSPHIKHAETEPARSSPVRPDGPKRPSLGGLSTEGSSEPTSSRRSSFFRLPRRKKAGLSTSSLNVTNPLRKSFDNAGPSHRPSADASRLTFEGIRATFENIKRPSMSARSSAASLRTVPAATAPTPNLASGSALVVASAALAAQGSPRLEFSNPLERLGLSRNKSVRSMVSLHSVRSSPAPDRNSRLNLTFGAAETADEERAKPLSKSRGRSLTYGGEASARKSSGNRASKFFSIGKLRRESDDPILASLGVPIAGGSQGASRGASPMPPLSPAKTLEEKPHVLTPPARLDDESPHMFLARLEEHIHHNVIASVLAASDDAFHLDCLQQYMQKFDFTNDPLDMALRKLLMETKLPRETQQIDRVIDTFSARYQVCNPRLFKSRETPHILTFALIMLHTDRFNQANKYKMTKQQFIKNTTSEQTDEVNPEVLDYFYDNIVSTPFILVEDEPVPSPGAEPIKSMAEFGSTRTGSSATSLQAASASFSRRSVDVYALIMEKKLGTLQPQLSDVLFKPNTLSYTGTLPVINVAKLHLAFVNAARLQLVSERSRPEAYISEDGQHDPLATEPGLVDVKITKIGILKKKEQKRANSKPVYREWGVMLTASQLLFFKDLGWVRHYMQQTLEHKKPGLLTLTPPVHNYAPDTYMPTGNTVALHDQEAKKRTHFSFLGRGGECTELAASSEEEMNDWVAKINYAAAFHTAGITIRGIETSGAAEARSKAGRRARRHGSSSTLSSVAPPTQPLEPLPEVVAARQNLIRQKIKEMDTQLVERDAKLQGFYRHARSLATLTPILPRTRQHLMSAAAGCSAKISWARQEMMRTQCHRDILVKDLGLELDPKAQAFTAPARPSSPSLEGTAAAQAAAARRASLTKSPSKVKLNQVGQALRQASSDTLKRVQRPFSLHESRREASSGRPRSSLAEEEDVAFAQPDASPELTSASPFQFGRASLHPAPKSAGSIEAGSGSMRDQAATQDRNGRPSTAPSLSVDIPRRPSIQARMRRLSKDSKATGSSHPDASGSVTGEVACRGIASPTSMGSGPFLLHGRKVSVVQTPVALVSPIMDNKDRDKSQAWPVFAAATSPPTTATEWAEIDMPPGARSPGTLSDESFQDALQYLDA